MSESESNNKSCQSDTIMKLDNNEATSKIKSEESNGSDDRKLNVEYPCENLPLSEKFSEIETDLIPLTRSTDNTHTAIEEVFSISSKEGNAIFSKSFKSTNIECIETLPSTSSRNVIHDSLSSTGMENPYIKFYDDHFSPNDVEENPPIVLKGISQSPTKIAVNLTKSLSGVEVKKCNILKTETCICSDQAHDKSPIANITKVDVNSLESPIKHGNMESLIIPPKLIKPDEHKDTTQCITTYCDKSVGTESEDTSQNIVKNIEQYIISNSGSIETNELLIRVVETLQSGTRNVTARRILNGSSCSTEQHCPDSTRNSDEKDEITNESNIFMEQEEIVSEVSELDPNLVQSSSVVYSTCAYLNENLNKKLHPEE